jgi:hypothetical protein
MNLYSGPARARVQAAISKRVREMRAQSGAHGKSSIFAIAITEFAAKCEPTAGLNAPGIGRSQEIRLKWAWSERAGQPPGWRRGKFLISRTIFRIKSQRAPH